MIYSTVGVPGRASEWCERILHRLVGEAGAEPARFVADHLADIAEKLLSVTQPDAVVTSRMVENRLCDLLLSDKKPFLISIGTPEQCVKSLMADYDVSFPDAVRQVARSLTSILPLLRCPHALVLDSSTGLRAQTVAKLLVGHFEIDISQEAIARALEDVPEKAPARGDDDIGSFANASDREDFAIRAATASRYGFDAEAVTFHAVLKRAVEPIWAHARGEPLKDIAWHPLLLLLGDIQSKPPIAALDITGESRCLVYGPYIALPKGKWTCHVGLKAEGEAAGANLRLEVYAGEVLKRVDFPLRGPGLVDVELSFSSPGGDAPIELRLFKTDNVVEGLVVMGTVMLHPDGVA